jgi:hypothetical protein
MSNPTAPPIKVWNPWNTATSKSSFLTLSYVLRKYRKNGHIPIKDSCTCCYICENCDQLLIDDTRIETPLIEGCRCKEINTTTTTQTSEETSIMTLRVWNTEFTNRASNLSLSHVLKIYRGYHHKPRKDLCNCCYYCQSCNTVLIDDLRTEREEGECNGL